MTDFIQGQTNRPFIFTKVGSKTKSDCGFKHIFLLAGNMVGPLAALSYESIDIIFN